MQVAQQLNKGLIAYSYSCDMVLINVWKQLYTHTGSLGLGSFSFANY